MSFQFDNHGLLKVSARGCHAHAHELRVLLFNIRDIDQRQIKRACRSFKAVVDGFSLSKLHTHSHKSLEGFLFVAVPRGRRERERRRSNRLGVTFELNLHKRPAMSSLEDSLIDGGPGSPSHASSPVSSLEDFSATRESGLGEEGGGGGGWMPGEGKGDGGQEEEEEEEDEEEIMEEFR